jgi:hypothetical protein
MDLAAIGAAYTGLKFAKEVFTGLLNAKVESEAREKIDAALSRVADAQDALFALRDESIKLQSENEALRKEIARHEDWKSKISQYALTKTEGGSVLYAFNGEPEHYACPACVSSKQEIQILQGGPV